MVNIKGIKKRSIMKVSIIVPVYNSEIWLQRCIQSILNQTMNDFELLLIDDGSTDSSGEICNHYKKLDSRVKAIHNINQGVSRTRNMGIDIAQGDYILFVDSDDYIEKNMLERMIFLIEKNKSDICISGFQYYILQNDKRIDNIPVSSFSGSSIEFYHNMFVQLYEGLIINAPWNKLISRKLICESNIRFNNNITIYEDLSFCMQLLLEANHITVLDEALYIYVLKEQGSLISRIYKNHYEGYEYFYSILNKYLDLQKATEQIRFKLYTNYVERSLSLSIQIYKRAGNNIKTYDLNRKIFSSQSFKEATLHLNKMSKKRQFQLFLTSHKLIYLYHLICFLLYRINPYFIYKRAIKL